LISRRTIALHHLLALMTVRFDAAEAQYVELADGNGPLGALTEARLLFD
jgi:hypothetical protein